MKKNAMPTVHLVLDLQLLLEADRAAAKAYVSRSALMRTALREHLKRRQRAEWEAAERRAYELQPVAAADLEPWQEVRAGPDD